MKLHLYTTLFLAMLGTSGCLLSLSDSEAQSPSKAIQSPTPTPNELGTYTPAQSLAPLVDSVAPSVIAIEVENLVQGRGVPGPMMREFEEFFGQMPPMGTPNEPQTVRGEGSGFIISGSGLVLTNHHVIDNAQNIRARFTDGTTVALTLVGSDERTDVALLQLPKDKVWPYVSLDTGALPKVGDWVVAMGNPLGLGTTVTAGIISGHGRDLPNGNAYDQFLQTDAAINQGNSGGPLFSLDGSVVGMNTAIIQGANTIGFAIPGYIIQRVMTDLESKGYVSRGFIGVSAQPLDKDLAEALGMASEDGALIAKIFDGTPADNAGLFEGDVIVSIDDIHITDPSDLVRAIGAHHPGDRVVVHFIRGEKAKTLSLKLGELPSETEPSRTQRTPKKNNVVQNSGPLSDLGIELSTLSPQLAAKAGLKEGVLVQSVERGSSIDGKLQAGDIILQVNNRRVASPDTVASIVAKSKGYMSFLVVRGERQMYIAVSTR